MAPAPSRPSMGWEPKTQVVFLRPRILSFGMNLPVCAKSLFVRNNFINTSQTAGCPGVRGPAPRVSGQGHGHGEGRRGSAGARGRGRGVTLAAWRCVGGDLGPLRGTRDDYHASALGQKLLAIFRLPRGAWSRD